MFLKIIEVDPFLSGNATLEALLSGIATSRVYGVKVVITISRLVFSTLGRLYHLGACVDLSQPAGFGISTCTQRAMAPAAKLGVARRFFFPVVGSLSC